MATSSDKLNHNHKIIGAMLYYHKNMKIYIYSQTMHQQTNWNKDKVDEKLWIYGLTEHIKLHLFTSIRV